MTVLASHLLYAGGEVLAAAASAPDPHRFSPRAAYQAMLWNEAVLMDVRSDAVRAANGAVPQRLGPWVIGPADVLAYALIVEGRRVLLLDENGEHAGVIAEELRGLGIDAVVVTGGFAAWRRAGMPVQPV